MKRDDIVYADLVAGIYDAAMDSKRWPDFLSLAASSFRADTGVVWTHDFCNSAANFDNTDVNLSSFVGFDTSALESYAEYYSYRNIWAANEDGQPEGTVVTSSMLYPDAILPRTEFYNDWLRPQDLFYSLGSIVQKQDTRAFKMSFLRSESAGTFGVAELSIFNKLMPHLQSAIILHRRLHHLQTLAQAATQALDAIPHGIILVNASGTFLHANIKAKYLMDRTRAISVSATGLVRACSHTQDQALQVLIRQAVSTARGTDSRPGGVLRLQAMDSGFMQVLVTPLPGKLSQLGDQVAAAIFCSSPEHEGATDNLSNVLVRIYGMTPAEARLTQALVNGLSLKEYVDLRQISINTARTQLKAATAKTEAKRQSDLVRIVLTGPAVLRTAPCVDYQ